MLPTVITVEAPSLTLLLPIRIFVPPSLTALPMAPIFIAFMGILLSSALMLLATAIQLLLPTHMFLLTVYNIHSSTSTKLC